jgi:hypothetical protein
MNWRIIYPCYLIAILIASFSYGASESKDDPLAAPTPIGASNMFSKLRFELGDGSNVEFHSHELVRAAHALLQETASVSLRVCPAYASYNQQVEEAFGIFTSDLVSQAARAYQVDEKTLNLLIGIFYTRGAGAVVGNPQIHGIYQKIMATIRVKKGEASSDEEDYKDSDSSAEAEGLPKPKFGPFIEETYDDRILPIQVMPEYSALGYLGLARHIRTAKEPISGWWVNIGDRIILLRNLPGARQHFYVSDHGLQADVVTSTKSDLLSFTDKGRSQLLYPFKFWRFYNSLDETNKLLIKQRFKLMLNRGLGGGHCRNEFLLYTLSLPKSLFEGALAKGTLDAPYNVGTCLGTKDKSTDPMVIPLSEEEEAVLLSLQEDTNKEYGDIFDITLERIRYRGDIQTPTFVDSLFAGPGGGLSPFFTQIDNIFPPDDGERYRVFFILKELSKKLGEGLQEFLFRPLYCFGSREEGESYRGFADAFDRYYKNAAPRPAHELAREARALLQGKPLTDDSLYFLPNLLAAWILSEGARNETSVLSTLMLLDLIESRVSLVDEDGFNRYDWKYTVVHPRKPSDSRTAVRIKDLYGNNIDLANFDGTHPMAHGESKAHGKKPLGKGEELSAVKQKEGHLIIHWLSQRMRGMEGITCTPVEAKGSNFLQGKPAYQEIDKLLDAKEKPSKSIKRDGLENKWNILKNIKELLMKRLSSLENLLPLNAEASSSAGASTKGGTG